ncbi:MAG: hypothetical protein U5M53_12015 [Rhodoferax sp.]|nr:hypothetical protein [Rhodoferax sp.]
MNLSNTPQPTEPLSDGVIPFMSDAVDQADALMHRGGEALRHTGQNLQKRATHASEVASDYVRHEPLKSLLMAAATGAVLMGLASLLSRSHTPR